MGLPLPKTPLIGLLCQIIAFAFGIICMIPGQNGILEGAYIISFNTSMYGNDALATSNMFALNNSNPMFAVMTSMKPDFSHAEMPPALKGMNDAIMRRLEINMSDPETVKGIYNTPLKDVLKGGKEMVNGEDGQFKIASGISDFINGMSKQIAAKMAGGAGGAPPAAAPHGPARRATAELAQSAVPNGATVSNGAAAPIIAAAPIAAAGPNAAASSMAGSVPIAGTGTMAGSVPMAGAGTMAGSVPMAVAGPKVGALPMQIPGPMQAPVPLSAPVSSPMAPQTPSFGTVSPAAPGPNTPVQCPKNCVQPQPKGDGNPFGPPKSKPVIPPPGEWTSGPFYPIEKAIKDNGPLLSGVIKHGAIPAMNAQNAALRKAVPVYDFYSIYNIGVCWGWYTPDGYHTVGCGSSADWRDINIAPTIQGVVNKLVAPTAKIVGPIGLGPNMERLLGTMRIILLIMYINKIMTVVNQAFAFLLPVLGTVAMFAGMLPPSLHLKLSFFNFATSTAAAVSVFGGTMSVLGMMLGQILTMTPMNAMMSVDMHLGIPYILLCLVDSLFAVVGAVCWWKVWRMMVNGAKQSAEGEKQKFENQHGKVQVINVQPNNKEYDASWVKG